MRAGRVSPWQLSESHVAPSSRAHVPAAVVWRCTNRNTFVFPTRQRQLREQNVRGRKWNSTLLGSRADLPLLDAPLLLEMLKQAFFLRWSLANGLICVCWEETLEL